MELNIESLTKHYGDLYALGDFTVCLRPGVYGLLGPNGAGKSTLMNLLTDTVKREAGSIRYNGKEILELGRGYRALVGYMPQQQGYYEEFTVGRFLYYMAALKGLSRSKARGEITEFLEVVGLSDCLHKKMGSLSGGMRQRILLVQALQFSGLSSSRLPWRKDPCGFRYSSCSKQSRKEAGSFLDSVKEPGFKDKEGSCFIRYISGYCRSVWLYRCRCKQ